MRIKGKKYGIRTNHTIKYHDICKYCLERYPSCICWKQDNDIYMYQNEPEIDIFKRDRALLKRKLYCHRVKMEEQESKYYSEDEIETKKKPEFDRRIHKPHLRVDNYKESRGIKKKVKAAFQKDLKSEEF